MSRFNTGNNLNSLDERDFYDNCLSLDQAMNSTDPTWRDRFNVEKPTIDAALKSAGFMPAGFDFVTGGTLQPGDRNKAVYNPAPNGDNNWYRWNGVFPKEIAANSQPNPKDENNWVPVLIKTGAVEREALRRTYLETGYNLVEGSFEQGGVLVNVNDVLLQERTGKVFSGPAGVVATGTNPASGGFVDKSGELASASAISNANGGSVQDFIDSFALNLVKSQPVCPPSTDSTKLIMRPTGEIGFWVVSKRARNRGGFIMTLVRDDVASADANNTGGLGITRPSVVNNCPYVYVANSVASATSGDVTQPTLDQTFIDSVWRYNDSGTNFSYFSETVDSSVSNLQNRKLYNVNSGTGNNYVEFRTRGDSTLNLGTSPNSSESVEIQVLSDSGSLLYIIDKFSLRQSGTGVSIGKVLDVTTPEESRFSFYRVRVVNRSVNVNEPCYVAGMNIALLDEVEPTTYITNAIALRSTTAPRYRAASGANEFAAREDGGKFFGTYHGGHDQIFERLRADNSSNYDIQADAVPSLLLTRHCTLYSKSRLKPDSGNMSFEYLLTVRFADGLDMATQSINVTSGFAPICSDVYTHMCTTDTTFDYIYQPKYFESLQGTNTLLGDTQTIEQYRASGSLTMATFFSAVDVSKNNFGGAYIQDSPNFHKQYYGPIAGKKGIFSGGTFTTIKEYF